MQDPCHGASTVNVRAQPKERRMAYTRGQNGRRRPSGTRLHIAPPSADWGLAGRLPETRPPLPRPPGSVPGDRCSCVAWSATYSNRTGNGIPADAAKQVENLGRSETPRQEGPAARHRARTRHVGASGASTALTFHGARGNIGDGQGGGPGATVGKRWRRSGRESMTSLAATQAPRGTRVPRSRGARNPDARAVRASAAECRRQT
jgi:hypothetical protein